MKIKPYLDKLNSSDVYKEFINKYKDSFLVAGFFILDLEMGKNIHQIDYYVPSEKKVAAFNLDGGVSVQLLETMHGKSPEKLDIKTNIDLDALPGILEDEMKNRNITEEIKKIIAILQTIDGKKLWNLSCILSGMEILKAHIDDESKTVLKMEKNSMFEIMKKVPKEELMKMQKPATKYDIKGEISKLDKLEQEIEKEKERLQKEFDEKPAKSKTKSTK